MALIDHVYGYWIFYLAVGCSIIDIFLTKYYKYDLGYLTFSNVICIISIVDTILILSTQLLNLNAITSYIIKIWDWIFNS